jgi:hypothetical protein
MRRFGMVFGVSACALLTLGILGGYAQQGKKGGFGGGMFGGGVGKNDPVALLNRDDVKKELDLSEEQTEKLPGAVMKAVAEVLNDKQMKRFRQIELQVRGTQAFVKDETLKKQLKLTDSQTKNIEEILADSQKEVAELFKEAKGAGGFKGLGEKMQGINKEAKEKVMGVLTAEQKKQYKELVGEEFKFEQPKGFGKKKNDAE